MICSLAKYRTSIRIPAVILSLSIIVSICGCGGKGKEGKGATKPRLSASGKVEIDGKPVPAGTVTFISKDTGNNSSCPISNGTYANKKSDGPNSGENAVIVTAKEKSDGEDQWTWHSKVDVGEKGYTGDFSIKSADTRKPRKTVIDN
jgi:hypothetical protein